MDHYSTLGVSKNATQDDIKKAYRKLASKHHPDKGGSESDFKKVQEAYEILGDENKRAQYDNPQPQFQYGGGSPFEGFGPGFDDFFSQFRQGHRAQQQYRNPDAVVGLNIDLKDAYTGRDMLVDAGFAREVINIPAGARDHSKIRVHGKGHHRFKDAPPGDLVIKLNIMYPPGVSRDTDDIYQRLTISAFDAILGSELNFEHFSGRVFKLKIPRGSQTGSKLRLSRWGMPNPQSGKPGDLYVVLHVEVPYISDETVLEKLKAISQEVKK